MTKIMTRKIITTNDGSHSLFVPKLNEHYHSTHGAITESKHVFLEAGLQYVTQNSGKPNIQILEVGMGTGLNVFLTFLYAQKNELPSLSYTAIEAHPLSSAEFKQLNYPQLLNANETQRQFFEQIHFCEANKSMQLSPNFTFCKWHSTLQATVLPQNRYTLVYFDAFAPDVQPELWQTSIFEKLFHAIKSSGILTTYCAKGSVKRTLKQVGFILEALPGPPGKREMTRATKKIMA